MQIAFLEPVFILFGVLFIVASPVVFVLGLNRYFNGIDSKKWPSTRGRVVESEVSRQELSSKATRRAGQDVVWFHHIFSYTYTINGQTYQSNKKVYGESDAPRDAEWAKAQVNDYPIGKDVDVYYNPKNPKEAILKPNVPDTVGSLLQGGAVLLVFGIALLLLPQFI